MNKLTIINNSQIINIILNKTKYICGNDYATKDMIIKVLINSFNKISDSDFAIENNTTSKIKYDDEDINNSDFNFYCVTSFFDLNQDIKLGSKSLSLAYLNAVLDKVEYNENYQTIKFLLEDLLEELKDDIYISPLLNINFSKNSIIKLLSFSFEKDENEINNYDLSLEEKINLQIDLINKIILSSKKKTIIIIDCPIIYKTTYKKLEEMNCYILFFFEYSEINKINNFLFINKNQIIDLLDDNLIFEICNNYHKYLTIEEMKMELIKNHFDVKVLK